MHIRMMTIYQFGGHKMCQIPCKLNGFSVERSLAFSQTVQTISHLKEIQYYSMEVSPEK